MNSSIQTEGLARPEKWVKWCWHRCFQWIGMKIALAAMANGRSLAQAQNQPLRGSGDQIHICIGMHYRETGLVQQTVQIVVRFAHSNLTLFVIRLVAIFACK